MPSPPLKWISIQGYRAARDLEFEPGLLMALVGEASSGKSTVLTAIWTLLEAAAPPPTIEDITRGTTGRIHLEAELERGSARWRSGAIRSSTRPTPLSS